MISLSLITFVLSNPFKEFDKTFLYENLSKKSIWSEVSQIDFKSACMNSIDEKIERQIQETTYALKRGKEWRIQINADPDELRWDQEKNKRKKTIQRKVKNKARINVDPRSIAPDFKFSDRTNLKLKVDHSFGSISQDLNISGKDGDTKIIGIKGFGSLGRCIFSLDL